MKGMLFLAALATLAAVSSAATDKVVCYYGSWAVYRHGNGKFNVEDINTDLCTHIIYTFLGLNADGTIRIMDAWNEIDLRAIERTVNLKSRNPNLKVLIAIGGWNEGSLRYSDVMNNPTLRSTFVNAVVNFVRQYKLDGFDLDWEYPAQRGGRASDRAAFVSLIQELRAIFDQNGWLLSAAVAASSAYHSTSYDVPELSRNLDMINVMAYDLHGSWDKVTGQNAPLYASSIDTTAAAKLLNVDAVITDWIAAGADPAKLVLGMGTYGRSFTLENAGNNRLGAAAPNGGNGGPYTAEAGFLGYLEICEKLNSGWTVVWDDEQKVPYAYSGNQWVGYDNVRSIQLKTQYAVDKKLGGAMIWSIETDDYKNVCGEGAFPILGAINSVLKGSSGSQSPSENIVVEQSSPTASPTTTTTKATTTTTTTTTTTAAPSGNTSTGNICQAAGYVRDPTNCKVFYMCQKTASGFSATKFTCGGSLVFDTKLNVCNYANQVTC